MSVLLIAEHDNSKLKPFTLNAITAASKIDSEVHVLVAGTNCENITKEVSSPNVSVKKTNVTPNENALRDFRNKVKEVNKFVKQNFEFVGDQFAYEARKIHYSKSNKKPVYGNATKEEVTDLSDEGIEVTSIPWIKEDN